MKKWNITSPKAQKDNMECKLLASKEWLGKECFSEEQRICLRDFISEMNLITEMEYNHRLNLKEKGYGTDA